MPTLRAEDVEIRPLDGHAEMEQCVALQRITWGEQFDQVVPATILWVAQRTGGIASGAFADGRLLGFVFGISGIVDRRPIHWSDMLAVHPDARGLGLGVALKLHQRELLLARGIDTVYWTFDPLEARNAHINFHRLGIVAREYLRDVYGETGSHLHAGIGTDRLLAEWRIASPRVEAHLAGRAPAAANDRTSEALRLRVPLDIQTIKRNAPERAVELRRTTRAWFEEHLARGLVVVDAVRRAESLEYVLAPFEE